MTRKQIKQQARSILDGNLITVVVLSAISVGIPLVLFNTFPNIYFSNISPELSLGLSFIQELLSAILGYILIKYLLVLAKKQKRISFKAALLEYSFNEFGCYLLILMLVNVLVGIAAIFFVIPGIVVSLGFTFSAVLFLSGNTKGVKESLSNSWVMTRGRKMDLLVLSLSFIGWAILGAFTYGLSNLYLIPYMELVFILQLFEYQKEKES